MPNKINMPFKTDIAKHWPLLEGKALELFIEYFRVVVCGTEPIEGVIYYYKKMTHRQQGKVSGYADCLGHIDYMINEDD